MSQDKAPREFIIHISIQSGNNVVILDGVEAHNTTFTPGEKISVVEKSAYTALEEKLRVAVEALEFYGDRESWNIAHAPDGKSGFIKSNDFDEFNFGGKRARETLAKVKK